MPYFHQINRSLCSGRATTTIPCFHQTFPYFCKMNLIQPSYNEADQYPNAKTSLKFQNECRRDHTSLVLNPPPSCLFSIARISTQESTSILIVPLHIRSEAETGHLLCLHLRLGRAPQRPGNGRSQPLHLFHVIPDRKKSKSQRKEQKWL